METNIKVIKKDAYKVMKTANVVDSILKVLSGFAIAGMAVAVIFMILTAFLGEKIIADASELDLGAAKITLIGERSSYLNKPWAIGYIYSSLAAVLVGCGAAFLGIRALRNILASMKEGEVFAEGVSKKIRTLGTTVLIGGGLTEIMYKVSDVIEMHAYDLDKILNKSIVSEIGYGTHINLWFVVTALVLYFLAFIFRCGEGLQKESDETL